MHLRAFPTERTLVKDTTRRHPRPSGPQGPKKPVTIDLPAEDVSHSAEAPAEKPAATSAPSDAPPTASAGARPAEQGRTDSAKPAGGTDGKRPPEPIIPSAFAAAAGPGAPSGSAPAAAPRTPFAAIAAAALAGGAVAALIVAVLAGSGLLGSRDADLAARVAALEIDFAGLEQAPAADTLVAPLEERLAGLEQAVGDLGAAPPEDSPDGAAIEDLQNRLAALEARSDGIAPEQADPGLAGRIAALAEDVEALQAAGSGDLTEVQRSLASLAEETRALSDRLDSAPTAERIAALEAEIDAASARAAVAAALGPAVVADALAAAVESGRPFETELAALSRLNVDDAAIDGLEPHAASGLPTLLALRSEFEAAIAPVELAAPVAEGAGAMNRLLQSARGLVEVRPARPVEGADPTAIVARIRGALEVGDVGAALAEWQALPADARAATADWAEAAEARHAADELVARLRVAALALLETEG